MTATEWKFFDMDGAVFRRPTGNIGGVTHVYTDEGWKTYQGSDRAAPVLFGDRCEDPEAGSIGMLSSNFCARTTREVGHSV